MCSDSGSQGSVFLVDTLGDSGKLDFFSFLMKKEVSFLPRLPQRKGLSPCFLLRKVTCGLLLHPFLKEESLWGRHTHNPLLSFGRGRIV